MSRPRSSSGSQTVGGGRDPRASRPTAKATAPRPVNPSPATTTIPRDLPREASQPTHELKTRPTEPVAAREPCPPRAAAAVKILALSLSFC